MYAVGMTRTLEISQKRRPRQYSLIYQFWGCSKQEFFICWFVFWQNPPPCLVHAGGERWVFRTQVCCVLKVRQALNACPGRRGAHPARRNAEGSLDGLWKHQAFGILGLLFLLQEMFLALGESWVNVPWSVADDHCLLKSIKTGHCSPPNKPSPNKGMLWVKQS